MSVLHDTQCCVQRLAGSVRLPAVARSDEADVTSVSQVLRPSEAPPLGDPVLLEADHYSLLFLGHLGLRN